MDRDYIWEGEYGRRSHLIPVFQQLLREQDASSLQMLSLFVNNNPYNLEFFIAVSYDRPKEEHLDPDVPSSGGRWTAAAEGPDRAEYHAGHGGPALQLCLSAG